MCNYSCSILTLYLDQYKGQAKSVPRHIPSEHSEEMAKKSDVVSILLHTLNKDIITLYCCRYH